MKNWILNQFLVRNDFFLETDKLNFKNKQPQWIINTKYTNKALKNKKVVYWFFLKKS